MKTLILYESYNRGNTKKVAGAIASALGAELKKPGEVDVEKLGDYDLIGFGSGIYGGKFHEGMMKLAGSLPHLEKRAFLFSTSLFGNKGMVRHAEMKAILGGKGLTVVGEFTCKGATQPFFNRGRPNASDLEDARRFAQKLTGTP